MTDQEEQEFWKGMAMADFTVHIPVKHKVYFDAKTCKILEVTTEDRDHEFIEIEDDMVFGVVTNQFEIKNCKLVRVFDRDRNRLQLEQTENGRFKTMKNDMLIMADGSITETDSYDNK